MSVELVLMLFLIGFIGSFLSGLVGIGGSIIKYPLLLYVPTLLGIASYSEHEVAGISAVQVFFAALAGALALRKEKVIHYQLVLYMGVTILIGSFVGAYGGRYMSGTAVNIVYAVLASAAAGMMFMPKSGLDDRPLTEVTFNRPIAVLAAFTVGVTSGIVGAAGAFLLVPIMLSVLKIPTRITVATSLAVTFLSSIGTTVGKVATGDVLWGPAVVMVAASVAAAPLGARLGTKVPPKRLRLLLIVLIAATAGKVWYEIVVTGG
jgi:uncharacterized membrane protein YfcA